MAQLSSLVTELKLITPQGKQMTITERNADLKRVLGSSFGLLGVVHEAVFKVQPLTPVKIDYEVLTLKEFGARFSGIVSAAGRAAAAHFTLQRSDHRGAAHAR